MLASPWRGCHPLLRRILDPPLINILPFHPQELVAGIVVVNSKQEVQHQGIYLAMEGAVSLQLSAKSVGLFEAFYNSLKVHIHRPPTKLREGYVFTRACDSVHRGHAWQGGMHVQGGRGSYMAGGHAWWGACMVGAYMAEGHAW